jgi:chromosomal replication initiator protein
MTDLDSRFTFENFVVGPANRLASAAARRAAESPGSNYNPLFLYSASGLGKTHILGAISHQVEKIHPKKSVVYQTLEGFLAELAESLQGGDRDGIRGRYEKLEILLMDDVQFLTGQAEAQEMLLRTLDSLTGAGKQVILASDRPPADIDGLDARLRTRFEGGLLVDIGTPEYETRVAIIRRQAESRGQPMDPGVAEVIGRIGYKNVRELGGALNRILAIQELEERSITPEEALALLGERDPGSRTDEAGDVGDFMGEISDTVAAQVERHEAPWRKTLRETAELAESQDFQAGRLRRLMEEDSSPADLNSTVKAFHTTISRLKEIAAELEAVGNPWPEAAHAVLRDPERLDEAEALLASARERSKPFRAVGDGPGLEGLSGSVPQLVIKAAEQLVNTERPEYNPLYVWSEDGEASTLLLAAAGRSYQAVNEGARVAFISVSEFAEEFIGALSGGVAGAWRERWWSAELLLVHGAEALSETERAQDEFFHLFEALQRRKARIMFAADCPPSRIKTIDDRLRSRFEGGLVLEVETTADEIAAAQAATEEKSTPSPEVILPPLEEFILDDTGMGGLYPEVSLPAGPEIPISESPDPAVEEATSAEDTGKDVSDLDREWILGFTAGDNVKLGRDVRDDPAPEEKVAAKVEETPVDEEWFPSPERVVWEWPRLGERVVEDPN